MIRCRLAVLLAERKIAGHHPYTYVDLAQEAGLNRVTVANFVNNVTTRFDAYVLDALCHVLDVNVGDLLEYIPDERPAD